MEALKLQQITGARMKEDRSEFTLELVTDRGVVELVLSAAALEQAITQLHGLEHLAALYDPVSAKQGEHFMIRPAIIDGLTVTAARLIGVDTPVTCLALKSGGAVRWFALDQSLAQEAIDGIRGAMQSPAHSTRGH